MVRLLRGSYVKNDRSSISVRQFVALKNVFYRKHPVVCDVNLTAPAVGTIALVKGFSTKQNVLN